MSFKRKLRRAAERKGFTAAELERVCRLVMQNENIHQIKAVDLGGSIDFTFRPDGDYRGNELVMSLCEGIYYYMIVNKVHTFTFPAPAAETKKHLAPISTQKQSVLA